MRERVRRRWTSKTTQCTQAGSRQGGETVGEARLGAAGLLLQAATTALRTSSCLPACLHRSQLASTSRHTGTLSLSTVGEPPRPSTHSPTPTSTHARTHLHHTPSEPDMPPARPPGQTTAMLDAARGCGVCKPVPESATQRCTLGDMETWRL
jgi:hypothetical protein